ncbi:MAG: aminoacyl-tRNA hydrolase [Chloroflexi bacterium]|nr:aminoacyl-tRNA hydrolase [Chloroflexota bacterium]MCL5108168.1 aminoacyl-tRNA hydrolase [Chloroflexota bacterium]
MWLVVGLGNPGRQYERSRHNVGFRCLDLVAGRLGVGFTRRGFNSLLATGVLGGQRVLLAKPQTYMNLSGQAVGALTRYYGLRPAIVLVIYDDMDLPLGRLRVRERGSSGGHRGLQSIIDDLGTQEFPRLRIGIGRSDTIAGAAYVLGRFAPEEETVLAETVARAADAVEVALSEGPAAAMNRFNS